MCVRTNTKQEFGVCNICKATVLIVKRTLRICCRHEVSGGSGGTAGRSWWCMRLHCVPMYEIMSIDQPSKDILEQRFAWKPGDQLGHEEFGPGDE